MKDPKQTKNQDTAFLVRKQSLKQQRNIFKTEDKGQTQVSYDKIRIPIIPVNSRESLIFKKTKIQSIPLEDYYQFNQKADNRNESLKIVDNNQTRSLNRVFKI